MGSYKIERSLSIKAPAREIWDRIMDVKSWPEWKPFITSTATGGAEIGNGSKFRMNIKVKGPLPFPVPVRVIDFDPYKYVAWTGGLPGMSVSVHSFIFQEKDGETLLTSREEFTGALVGLMLLFMSEKDFEKLHDDWLEAIRKRVEEQ